MDSRSVGNNNKIQLCAGPAQKMNAFFVMRNASNAQAQVESVELEWGGALRMPSSRQTCLSVCLLPPTSVLPR